MLQTEPRDFFVVRSEHIVLLVRHHAVTRERETKTRTEFRQLTRRQSASRAYQSTFRVTHMTMPSRTKSATVPMSNA